MSDFMRNRWQEMNREELLKAVEHYYVACCKIEAEIEEMVAPALGYEYDEEYGWVTGDHVAQSLVAELIAKTRPVPKGQTWVLSPDWVKPLTSLNDRLHWAVVKKATLRCKEWAMDAATAALIPRLEHCTVELVWTVPNRIHRDEENPMLDLKAICDGLVDAGVVPDDIPQYMTKLMPRIEYVKGQARVELIVTGVPVPVQDEADGVMAAVLLQAAVAAAPGDFS